MRDYWARTGLLQWLLVTTASERAQHLVPDLLPEAHTYRSSFDRVFLLDVPIRKVWGLTIVSARRRPTDVEPA